MRLTKAEFRGFGRLADTQINLDHKVVAIVGPNEAGKSTLLRALAYVDSGQSLTVAERSRGQATEIGDDDVVVRVQYRLSADDQAAVERFDLNEAPTELWLSRTAGPGDVVLEVLPVPRKNLVSLVSALDALKHAASDASLAALAPPKAEENADELDERRASFTGRLKSALDKLASAVDPDPESQATELSPTTWLEEFDEYGVGGAIAEAFAEVEAWMARDDPRDDVAQTLYNRSPDILMFSNDDRELRSSYELSEDEVRTPHAALRNIAKMAELPLAELWKTINNGDEGARETLIEHANQKLQTKFADVWNQSKISAHMKIVGARLEIRIKQDGRTITQFHERSAGVQMFVALVAFLTPKDRSEPPILLIDEAETHLHIDAQADLVNEFMTQRQAAKIIYTTHSPACLPPDLGTNIRAVVPDPENPQRSLIDGNFWSRGVGYSPLMLAMGAAAAAFSAARKVVLAEGATEMILLPSLIKQAIGAEDLEYQVAPGLSEAPVSMYPDLDLEGARVAFLVDGDQGGNDLRHALVTAGVPQERVVTLGAPTLENLLDPNLYKEVILLLINEAAGGERVTLDKLPSLPNDGQSLWPKIISDWAKKNGHVLPGKRVVASRLIEERLARPSPAGVEILKVTHEALTIALDGNKG